MSRITASRAPLAERLTKALGAAGRVLRAIAGAPDYDRYLAHMRERHPGETPLGRDDFAERRLRERYERPGSRCC